MNELIADVLFSRGVLSDVLFRGSLLLAGTGVATLFLRNRSAALRSGIWSMSFVALLLLLVLSGVLPSWRVVTRTETAPSVTYSADHRPTSPETSVADRPVSSSSSYPPVAEKPRPSVTAFMLTHANTVFFSVWILGAGLLLLRLVVHCWQIVRLCNRAVPDSIPGLREKAADYAAGFGIRFPVNVAVSSDTLIPFSCGLWQPTIVLPEEAGEWSAATRCSVLRHELGHVARRDYPLHILTEVVRALYWLNPLVWLAANRSAIEREKACDDMALLTGTGPNEYAHHLVEIAASVAGRSGVAPVLTMADRCGLHSRVNHVLASHNCRSRLGQTSVLTIAAVILAIATLLASVVVSADRTTIPVTRMLTGDLRDAPSLSARCRAAWWLGEHEDWDAVDPLIAALDDPSPEVRLVAAWALGEIKDEVSIDALVESLDDSDLYVREMAILALGEIEHPSAIRPLNETYKRDKEMGGAIAWALGEIGTSRARSLQRKILEDLGKTSLQTNQVWTGELEDRRDLKLVSPDLDDLIDQVHDDDAKIRRLAALKIGIIGIRQEFESLGEVEDAVDALISALRDPDPRVRAVAVWSLDEVNPSRALYFWNR